MRVAQHFDAVGMRHLDVGDDHIVESAFELSLRILSGLDRLDFVALAAQGNIQHLADGALVIANQNVTHALSLPCLPRQRLPRSGEGVAVSRPAASRAGSPQPPNAAAEGRRRYPLQLSSAPTLCLRGPGQSDTRWPNPARCLLRTATGRARRFSPPSAGSCRGRYRRSSPASPRPP